MASDICGTYQILDDGEYVGEILVYLQGLLTVFEGHCRTDREGPFRLALYSGGRTLILGVMLPDAEGYRFRKSFTKNALAELGLNDSGEFRIV